MPQWLRPLQDRLVAIEDRFSVRMQIAVAGAATVIVLVGSLAASAAYLSYTNTAALVNNKLSSVAAATADRLDRYMSVRQREVALFTRLQPMQTLWQDNPAALRLALDQLQQTFSDFVWIGFARPDGTVLASTGGVLEGASASERPWFTQGLIAPMVGDVHEAKMLAKFLEKRIDGEPYRFVDIAVPVYGPAGALLGVLGAHINWDWARDVIDTVEKSDGDIMTVSVFSADGKVLLGPQSGEPNYSGASLARLRASGNGLLSEVTSDDGLLTAFQSGDGYRDYKGLDWIVAASQPSSVAMAAAIRSAKTILAIGAIAGLVGVTLVILLARRISRPIRAITAEADRIGRASGPTMLPRQGGSAEVVQLTRALRSLLRRIGFAEERTKEAEFRASENARQFKDDITKLRQLADTDPLTGLMNRRAFLTAAEDAMEFSRRYDRGLATLVIDIDHFKKVNDLHGHAAGDAAIKRIAELIASNIRGTDKAARFGGEEFVVLLREVDEETARLLAGRICAAIEHEAIGYGTAKIAATVSIGFAVIAAADRDIEDLIERADQALYMAKNSGRNRVFFMPQSAAAARAA